MKQVYDFYHDPGHAWLKVPVSELKLLGLQDIITGYSYRLGDFAYLEEDVDMPKFLEFRKKFLWVFDKKEITIFRNRYSEKRSRIRNYPRYTSLPI